MLDTWDEQIAKTAAFIVEKRLRGIEKLSKLAQKYIMKYLKNGNA